MKSKRKSKRRSKRKSRRKSKKRSKRKSRRKSKKRSKRKSRKRRSKGKKGKQLRRKSKKRSKRKRTKRRSRRNSKKKSFEKTKAKDITFSVLIGFAPENGIVPTKSQAKKARKNVEILIKNEVNGIIKYSLGPKSGITLVSIGKLSENNHKTWIWNCLIKMKVPKNFNKRKLNLLTDLLGDLDSDGNYNVKVGKQEYIIVSKVKSVR